ncbi:5-methyltetrahydropteroyltriglutamate--homocysteine S-methyltransferase [Granulicatella adiacens ATCC 49175]|uniref:Methionine synthase, vitamin-B12 independent n=1 Tax=Granulicatella adiacens ATCC 49175 TaxID=638301 RepID=C8NI12_9LACT|nr:5-methyltetrahydropteroyltriglutamate--homocysteine S-methyltransferase [Granulicatella adiacens]EEW36825.1 methionine synthase, vitamin-B12 independent [Granulicatella adiacens ATCC 49175]UAK94592.1 5-methyltetrahydropteroyltriglutamate--homocysteine S-methyltransferase [Granulicatella adiacens]UWP38163.1 5-methyltetrahydropteroyltriglutamate--homocysteine S-methyltransferase [Granulicatella adiacens ATCC 49175]
MSNHENCSCCQKAPFRLDHVGSFLRPERLKEARAKFNAGEITAEELERVENEEIIALIEKEKELGLKSVTDGEFRRAFWHLDFLENLDGVELVEVDHFSVQFKDKDVKPKTLRIVGKVDFSEDHPFVKHFKFLKEHAGETPVKLTIPSPSMLHLITQVREKNYVPIERYKDNEVLFYDDVVAAYRKALQCFYDLGCRNIQLDDTSWGEFCALDKREAYEARGFDLEQIARDYVDVLNRVIEWKPEDLVVNMHICRGNFRSTWFSSGGYEPVAKTLFGHCRVDGFFLEYDSDRAGDFTPLRYIKDQKVVLGLITSKSGDLEDKGEVISRIKEASQYVPLEQLCLSPQCGFSSTEEGNILTIEAQWDKLKLIDEIVHEVWG